MGLCTIPTKCCKCLCHMDDLAFDLYVHLILQVDVTEQSCGSWQAGMAAEPDPGLTMQWTAGHVQGQFLSY